MPHGYLVALFDVLGFEKRLADLGLPEMLARYEALIDVIDYRKEQISKVFGEFGFNEAAYWTREGDAFIFNKIYGAYASDSLLLWASRTWPKARNMPLDACEKLAENRKDGWQYHPIPCDNFLDVCNDLVCRGIEVGLPLRGAIAIGDAVLDPERNIFLGQPIIDAARLEGGHQMIATSFSNSGSKQTIPARYTINFDRHIKESHRHLWGGHMLDWPRHWRNSRKTDVRHAIRELDTEPEHSAYYKNTLELISHSESYADRFESFLETSIRTQYEQFHWSNDELALPARVVRRIPIEPET